MREVVRGRWPHRILGVERVGGKSKMKGNGKMEVVVEEDERVMGTLSSLD